MNLHYSKSSKEDWSCYRHKSHTNTLLQNLLLYDILVICCFTIPWIYTTPKLYLKSRVAWICFATLWIYTTPKLPSTIKRNTPSFTTLWIYTTPKPQKRAEAATGVCITGHSIAFYYITSLLSEKHIECHACANLFNYPAILHFFRPSKRHLKLLPAQNARNYTTPKHYQRLFNFIIRFTTLWIYTTPKRIDKCHRSYGCFITL